MTARVTTTDLVHTARSEHSGIGAFNVVLLEHAAAIVEGARRAGLPVILQISENCIRYHGSLAPITRAVVELAASLPGLASVHLDHIEDAELIHQGVLLGVDSVMFDASKAPYDENVARTHDLADFCHDHGLSIEAELGEVGGKDGVHAPGARTDPAEAVAFVDATGVDALAVAVGTSHAMTDRTASVDLDLIARLASEVPVPLVLHGSSGLSDEHLQAAVGAGMTKINISTHLNALFTEGVRRALADDPALVDPRRYIRPGREAVAAETSRILTLLRTPATTR